MKTVLSLFAFLSFFSFQIILAQNPAQAEITFEEPTWNYDTMPEGDSAYHTFVFKNTGNAPLEIENAKPSCNCTVVETYSASQIAPGAKGEIVVKITTQGKSGQSDRSVTVVSNASKRVMKLEIIGFVGPPRGDESQNKQGPELKIKAPDSNPFGWD